MIEQITKTVRRCDTLVEDVIGLSALVAMLIAALHFPVLS
ncbi:hypothetical protein SAMN04488012_101380 [Palleronia salina]|uniref:Uncharacterized protein n=2 Tax=Palleronia TaxID=315422 RepID=A0A1M6B6W9_9RHOB|nr:hypothetical protein SAMN04488011_101777 [Palleronia pelagia]SHI44472.1 hypothetical protein SAMN04488012_101380 [Palleronia salina]